MLNIISDTVQEVVYSFPEYETVRSITLGKNNSIKESGIYQIMNSEETEAGGDFNRRIYKQSVGDLSNDALVFTT